MSVLFQPVSETLYLKMLKVHLIYKEGPLAREIRLSMQVLQYPEIQNWSVEKKLSKLQVSRVCKVNLKKLTVLHNFFPQEIDTTLITDKSVLLFFILKSFKSCLCQVYFCQYVLSLKVIHLTWKTVFYSI